MDAFLGEHLPVIFHVVPDFEDGWVFEQRFEQCDGFGFV